MIDWTGKDDLIRQHYPTGDLDALRTLLEVPLYSLRRRAITLGVKRDPAIAKERSRRQFERETAQRATSQSTAALCWAICKTCGSAVSTCNVGKPYCHKCKKQVDWELKTTTSKGQR